MEIGEWHRSGQGWICNCKMVRLGTMRLIGTPYMTGIPIGAFRFSDEIECKRCGAYRPDESDKPRAPKGNPVLREGLLHRDETNGKIVLRDGEEYRVLRNEDMTEDVMQALKLLWWM